MPSVTKMTQTHDGKPLRRKWERLTGVPNDIVIKTYQEEYRKREDAVSVDELRADQAQLKLFRELLGPGYEKAPLGLLGKQLESIRKMGGVRLGTGKAGPSKGYKERVKRLLAPILAEAGLDEDGVKWCLGQLDEADRNGLTPSQVRILRVLAKNPGGLNRVQIAEKAELSTSMISNLGTVPLEGDAVNKYSLVAQGLVRVRVEDQGGRDAYVYSITKKGKTAISS